MASWPTTLPKINLAGYGIAPVDQTVRTDMEGGAARSRRRTTARNDKITPQWVMTDAQFSIFRAWFDNAATGAAGGAGWFTISAAIGATGMTSVEARFIGPFKSSALGALRWSVSGELELR
jgi:hypothetical protein